ncbi:hypothetical protein CHARACLAT_033631 [Characodon lateralis]|uniref:Uncharacterized protein n=1 Tax=Characodon lateralis TaxID=208331 RepID=A0ABU7DEH5_9TELE|nr:hypothetical protein [Characodon lateralis]
MEGEFDRELDRNLAPREEAPSWVDLETQLTNMQALVLQTRGKEEGEKMKKKIEKKVREAMKKDGLELTDRQNLGGWLKKQMNAAKEIRQEAEGTWNGATVWSKGKYRTYKEKCEKEERFWGVMVLIHQGGKHTMKQQQPRGGAKKEGPKAAKGMSPDTPPPYAPSSKFTHWCTHTAPWWIVPHVGSTEWNTCSAWIGHSRRGGWIFQWKFRIIYVSICRLISGCGKGSLSGQRGKRNKRTSRRHQSNKSLLPTPTTILPTSFSDFRGWGTGATQDTQPKLWLRMSRD